MGEGIEGYPRWQGHLSTGSRFATIARQELARTWSSPWGMLAVIFILAITVFRVAQLQVAGLDAHTGTQGWENAISFLDFLRWGVLGLAAVMAGPALLEDRKHNALELYLSKAVTRFDYLAGKVGATFDAAALAMIGPGVVYWITTYFLFDTHPEGWLMFPLGVIAYGLIWAALVAGLGLGLSCVSKSGRAAALILFGVFAISDILVSSLLEGITRATEARILSPFAAHAHLSGWLFQTSGPDAFPVWWGALQIAILSALGWFLVWWKHPRLAGVES